MEQEDRQSGLFFWIMRTRTKLLEMREQGWEMREKGLLFLVRFASLRSCFYTRKQNINIDDDEMMSLVVTEGGKFRKPSDILI